MAFLGGLIMMCGAWLMLRMYCGAGTVQAEADQIIIIDDPEKGGPIIELPEEGGPTESSSSAMLPY